MLAKSPSKTEWKIQIYRVRDERHQQHILSTINRSERPGVIALGAQSGPDKFVILECCSLMNQIWARRIVMMNDPLASRTYECEERPEDVRTRRI